MENTYLTRLMKKLSLPDNISTRDLFSNFIPRGPEQRALVFYLPYQVIRLKSTSKIKYCCIALQILEPNVESNKVTIQLHTDCKTLVNRLKMTHINRPSLVLSDHMDLIYQIREIAKTSKFQYEFIFTFEDTQRKISTAHARPCLSLLFAERLCKIQTILRLLPGADISITANNKPIVSGIGMSIQDQERSKMRESYFLDRMQIHEQIISNVDTYTLGRVFMKTPKRHAIYTKIIHRQLNTMSVNERWSRASE